MTDRCLLQTQLKINIPCTAGSLLLSMYAYSCSHETAAANIKEAQSAVLCAVNLFVDEGLKLTGFGFCRIRSIPCSRCNVRLTLAPRIISRHCHHCSPDCNAVFLLVSTSGISKVTEHAGCQPSSAVLRYAAG